jgi:peptidoglycan hydrolase CwlO-like protein
MIRIPISRVFFVLPMIITIGFFSISPVQAITAEEISQKNKEIEAIQKEIEQYQQQIDSIQPTKATLQSEVAKLTAKINQLNLEIKSLGLSINKTNLEVKSTQEKIKDAEENIAKNQVVLGQYLRILYQNDQETLTGILLKHDVLSDFFNDLNSVKTTQDELRIAIDQIQALKASLEQRGEELEEKRIELERQKGLEEINKRSVDQNKAQKDKLLKDTKGQESRYQTLVKQSQSKIEKIRAEIYYLQQNGVSADDVPPFL